MGYPGFFAHFLKRAVHPGWAEVHFPCEVWSERASEAAKHGAPMSLGTDLDEDQLAKRLEESWNGSLHYNSCTRAWAIVLALWLLAVEWAIVLFIQDWDTTYGNHGLINASVFAGTVAVLGMYLVPILMPHSWRKPKQYSAAALAGLTLFAVVLLMSGVPQLPCGCCSEAGDGSEQGQVEFSYDC